MAGNGYEQQDDGDGIGLILSYIQNIWYQVFRLVSVRVTVTRFFSGLSDRQFWLGDYPRGEYLRDVQRLAQVQDVLVLFVDGEAFQDNVDTLDSSVDDSSEGAAGDNQESSNDSSDSDTNPVMVTGLCYCCLYDFVFTILFLFGIYVIGVVLLYNFIYYGFEFLLIPVTILTALVISY